MAGIVFLKTKDLKMITEFYLSLGATVWLEQKDITIFKHGNLLFGFHQQEEASKDALLTFFYPTQSDVDKMYKKYKSIALGPPKINPSYNIYNFFAKDPEERLIEFQVFLHAIEFKWET
ncbi:MAG: VOC family protein [Candidatus Hodarchaeales archaeon]|jgi:predicted lactoylglutathione lyase